MLLAPGREGEAISWHVHEMLKGSALLRGVHVQRITFNEITKKALLDALAAPREVRGTPPPPPHTHHTHTHTSPLIPYFDTACSPSAAPLR